MSTTLIELPPELDDLDESSAADYVEAGSVQELAEQTHISDEEVLDRLLLPGHQFGPYRVMGFIAAGGMGEIYAAERHSQDGPRRQPVALKVISSEHAHDWRIVERFKREASISKAIRSDHVIRVYEYGETDRGQAFLSMELLAGEELFERLYRVRTLPLDDLTDLALQVLGGLSDIHQSGFIHRDIKPENIFLTRQPGGQETAKILDFGIAKRRDERSDPLLSVAGQVYGTPEYLAPEQAVNPDVDPRADLYSVGIMLYEAASGSLPFDGDTSYSIIAAHQNEVVPPLPSSIDSEFAEIVYASLAKNPADRFQTAAEMARVLERWRDHTSWVDEWPGASDLTFEDVFDSQELTPASAIEPQGAASATESGPRRREQHADKPSDPRPVKADQPTAGGLDELSAPRFFPDEDEGDAPFEKLSVSRARDKRRGRPEDPDDARRTTAEVARSDPPARREAPSPGSRRQKTDESDPAVEQRRRRQDDPTVVTSRDEVPRAKPDPDAQNTRLAQIVTWGTVALIIAAIIWAFYPADDHGADPSSPTAGAASSGK